MATEPANATQTVQHGLEGVIAFDTADRRA